MKHLDLFSGIGGFALAARWMEWQTVGFVEIDKFCQKVLAKNFPNIPIYGDIKEFKGTELRGTVDILTGGFPCQPYSIAGRRKGTEDDRHLWPEMLRVIGEIQPSWIVGENVYGLVNWNGGMVFEEVQTSLEDKGYEVTSVILPACAVNAPHRRDRIWIIANRMCERSQRREKVNDRKKGQKPHEKQSSRCYEFYPSRWEGFNIESWIHRESNGIPNKLDRIKGLGNAVVPQLVFEIYKAIESCLELNQPESR